MKTEIVVYQMVHMSGMIQIICCLVSYKNEQQHALRATLNLPTSNLESLEQNEIRLLEIAKRSLGFNCEWISLAL